MSALPRKSPDPAMLKLLEAYKMIREVHNELGDRSADSSRSIARNYLDQSMQMIRRAADFEGRAL